MDNLILSDLMAEYEKRREENAREEDRRKQEILDRCPELAKLAAERHELILRAVRGAFSQSAPADLESRMADLTARIAGLLEASGYPRDYLAPIYTCPICRDTGYVYAQSVQKPCVCLQKAYQDAARKSGAEEGRACFASFDETRFPEEPLPGSPDVTQRQYMRMARERCRKFANQLPAGPLKTLLLHGGSGLGKTFLLHCVENAARDRGIDTLYIPAYDLLARLRSAWFSGAAETAAEFFSVTLLLIDDLGMEPLIETVTVEQIYHLLNDRLIHGLPTAVSTNLSRSELKSRYTERVSSRLLDTRTGEAIPLLGRDIRLIRS